MTRWMIALCAVLGTACDKHEPHDHAGDHPEGHDHHAEGHGHDEAVVRITRWSKQLELFAEHPALVAGKEAELIAHLTVLDGFRPLDAGELELELGGPGGVRAHIKSAVKPGIFRIPFVVTKAGKYKGRLSVKGKVTDTFSGLAFEVFDSEDAARASVPKEEEGRHIELLKEQQWGVDFATVFAARGKLIASIEVAGTIDTPPGGSGEVGAPIAGRLVAPAKGLPKPGDAVKKGQVLASLAPAPSSPEEAARAGLAVTEAEARASRARSALERAERLIVDQAISQRELEDARREVKVAEDSVRAAKSARDLFSGAAGGTGGGSWRLVSPIDGVLAEVRAKPGAAVSAQDVLFRVVDMRELWIRARVPEQDASKLRADRDASFQIAGLEDWLPIVVSGDDPPSSLVTVSPSVDPASRTVDVIYALRKPDPKLRVGGLVKVSVPAGADFEGIVVKRSAIVDEEGRSLVYVQVDGEHFEERAVRTGPRQGGLIAVVEGLSARDRVVVGGTHIVRLAARSGSSAPHGHIH